jgi:protein involved in polysaccharide export with SLBB domain
MGVLTAGAQSMSDQQILDYVQREMKAGTPEAQIAIKLMQRGVDVKQIQRLRQLNGKQSGGSFSSRSSRSTGSAAAELSSDSRLRESNGSVRVDREGNPLYTSMDGYNPLGSSELEINNLDMRPNVYIKDSMNLLVNGKQVFGRDIFNKRTLSFEPNMNISTPTNYVLGAGDYIVIDIFGASQKSHNLEVSPDGTVTVEGFGPIKVGGLTVEAANQKIRERLGGRYSNSRIEMTVAQTRTITVNVMGEVAVPGTYTLSAFASVFHALYMAGGVNGVGTLRNIKVYRNGRQLTVVDVYDYILNGRLTGNIRLGDNDVIVVGPYECIVDIGGEVKRPMAYEMKSTESVATLLKYAGGFSNKAYKKAVRLIRTGGERYSAYSVPEFEMADFRVVDGDSITVDAALDRYENTVRIRGAVFHPGMYDLDGTTTIRTLIERSGGLTEEAFSSHAILYRMKEDRTHKVISIDVDGLMAGTVADIALENEDDLYIPYRLESMSKRTLTIHGEVQFPGEYEYAENLTIEDLILQAGGPTDATSTARVDVARRINDPAATSSDKAIAQTFNFSLKNGYVVDGDRNFTLQPYDEVYVRKSPGYHPQRNIQVLGEVLFEGTYSLPMKNMRLSDAIKAAGGVTGEAYVRGARVERLLNPDEKFRVQNLMKMAQQQTGKGLDTTMVTRTDSIYYVGINLDKALENPGSDYDIILREGDKLVVPEYNGTVKINGNVMYPNTVAYSEGKDYKWYVNQAGGFGNRSKKSRTYILYQNGTVSKAKGGAKIEPGCEIIVPAKTKSASETISQIGSLGTTMATIVTLLVSVLNLVK